MATHEVAAGHDPGPPPADNPIWLIAQRLDDIRREQDRLRAEMDSYRAEVAQLGAEFRSETGQLRAELNHLRNEFRAEMHELRNEMRVEVGQLRAGLKEETPELPGCGERDAAARHEVLAAAPSRFLLPRHRRCQDV